MKKSDKMREQIFGIVKNQMAENDPPETNDAFNRLIKEGYSEFETKQLIAQCIAVEIFNIAKHKQPFDKERYVKNLNNLPKEPFD